MEFHLPNLDTPIFRINHQAAKPQAGALLVAEPFLREEYFNHGVIALIEYKDGESSMGLVLNKPTGYTLGEAIEGINDEVDIPIFCGGPLSTDRLFYIHTLGDEFDGSVEIAENLYVGGDFDQVRQYVNLGFDTEGKIRFFVGYSGWDARQLDDEIARHVWAVDLRPKIDEIMTEQGDTMWYNTVRHLGKRYRNWLYHPVNPQLN